MGSQDRDAALVRLFNEEYGRVVRVAFLIVQDRHAAEELAQEAFVRVWRRWGAVRDPEAAAAFLRRTVVNLARSKIRRLVLERRVASEQRRSGVSEPDAAPRLDALRALRALPVRQRACVVLRYYEDMTEAETAAALGISVGTVKSQTHKALKRLATLLGGEQDDA
ncbi:MAG TPA: SigE family RNA polymerase sigma factor [Actinomycetota bacterium]|nr:SigE family RNA polymerase sigma factor [Actinomycetota bacterium]